MTLSSKKLRLIPSVIFMDLGGVLFYDEYVELYYIYQIFSQLNKSGTKLQVIKLFEYRNHLYPTYKNDWIRCLLNNLVPNHLAHTIISSAWNKVLEKFKDLFKPYPQSLNFLKKLNQNFPVYCVANQPLKVDSILNELGFKAYFKEIFLDQSLGYSKPDRRLFQFGLKKIGKGPLNVIHIGDRLDNDIIPAIQCGMQAIKITHPIRHPKHSEVPLYFSKCFYQSLQKKWHRLATSTNLEYTTCRSYEEILQYLFKSDLIP